MKITDFLKNNFYSVEFILQTEKIELETTVVDETKERESYCGQGDRRFSGWLFFTDPLIQSFV